jgi:hypothetical protein
MTTKYDMSIDELQALNDRAHALHMTVARYARHLEARWEQDRARLLALERVLEAARKVASHYMATHDPEQTIMDENGLLAALAAYDAQKGQR